MATAAFYLLRLTESLADAALSVSVTPNDADLKTAERHASAPLHGNIRRATREYVYRIDTWEKAVGELIVQLGPNNSGSEVLVRLPAHMYFNQEAYRTALMASPLVASVRHDDRIVMGFIVTLTPAALADTSTTYQVLANTYATLLP